MKNKIVLFLLITQVSCLCATGLDIRIESHWPKDDEFSIAVDIKAPNIATLVPAKDKDKKERGTFSFSAIGLRVSFKPHSTAHNARIHLDEAVRTPRRVYEETGKSFVFSMNRLLIDELITALRKCDPSIFSPTHYFTRIIVESVEKDRRFANLYRTLRAIMQQFYEEFSREQTFVKKGWGQPDILTILDIKFDWYGWFKENIKSLYPRNQKPNVIIDSKIDTKPNPWTIDDTLKAMLFYYPDLPNGLPS